jgi:flagellar protein FlaJ
MKNIFASKKKAQVPKKASMERFYAFSYKAFGKRFDDQPNSELADKLRRANVGLTPGMYKATILMSVVLLTGTTLIFSLLVFLLILELPNWELFTLVLVGIAALVGYLYLPMTLNNRITNRKIKIDQELAFSLSELSILASTGLSPIEVMRRMSQRCKNEAMLAEYKKIVYKIDIEGKDIISALGETARETPSTRLRESLWDLANMIHQGGNLDEYLRKKADEVLSLKRTLQKEFVDRLMGLSEVFVSLVLVGVLFIGIAAFLLQATGTTAGSIDGGTLLLLLAFLIVPLSAFAFIMIISTAYSKTE